MTPVVSVVIPTYNRAAFLEETVYSVVESTLHDIELLIVDDGSTDDTAAVVQRIDVPLHYHYQRNGGLAAARNSGMQRARGDFILFLDSDDLITKDKLALQATLLQRSPVLAAVYSRWDYIDERGRTLVERDGVDYTADAFGALSISNFAPIHSYLFRRRAIQSIAGFSEDLDGCGYEDWDLLIRLALSGAAFGFLPHVTARYRMHAQNMCSVSAESLCRCGMDVIARMRRSSGALSDEPSSLPAALVHMEACSQLHRRGCADLAVDYGASALRHFRDIVLNDMFFHYLATFNAPPELGHAAFALYRRPPTPLIERAYADVFEVWSRRADTSYSPAERVHGFGRLHAWLGSA